MKKNIIVIFPNSFPISGAATNRIISICKGLIEQGNQVKVIINRPTEKKDNQLNFESKGVFKNIPFEYSTTNLIWPDTMSAKFREYVKGLFFTLFKILQENKKQKVDIIISAATYGIFENVYYKFIGLLVSAKLVHTVDEFPWVLIYREKYSDFYRNFYLKFYYKIFDGFIIMTKALLDFCKKRAKKQAKFVHIPMTVEAERFHSPPLLPIKDHYIAYVGGDKSGTKDGLDILIKAYQKLIEKFPEIKLYIIGHVSTNLQTMVKQNSLTEQVKFLGFVKRDIIPSYLKQAKLLCLARPDNLQAQGGFPTKLGEYLASGTPVVVTDVGEITYYLKDGINAYIAQPGSVESFAEKLIEAMSNFDQAQKIGLEGQKVAFEVFDYKNNSIKLSKFLNEAF